MGHREDRFRLGRRTLAQNAASFEAVRGVVAASARGDAPDAGTLATKSWSGDRPAGDRTGESEPRSEKPFGDSAPRGVVAGGGGGTCEVLIRGGGSRRRRGHEVDIPRRGRRGAAAGTWIFRGDG